MVVETRRSNKRTILGALTLGLFLVTGVAAAGIASAEDSRDSRTGNTSFSADDCAAANETSTENLDDGQVVDCLVDQTSLSKDLAEELVGNCSESDLFPCIDDQLPLFLDEEEPQKDEDDDTSFSADDCAAANETSTENLDDGQVVDCLVDQTSLSKDLAEELVGNCSESDLFPCIDDQLPLFLDEEEPRKDEDDDRISRGGTDG